jgi:hypothetical protein
LASVAQRIPFNSRKCELLNSIGRGKALNPTPMAVFSVGFYRASRALIEGGEFFTWTSLS